MQPTSATGTRTYTNSSTRTYTYATTSTNYNKDQIQSHVHQVDLLKTDPDLDFGLQRDRFKNDHLHGRQSQRCFHRWEYL